MANKIKLGARPESFKSVVTFPLLDGTIGKIEVTYAYRTRTEWGALLDEINQGAPVPPAQSGEPEKIALSSLFARSAEGTADYLLKICKGWDLDAPFNRASLLQLADECPVAVRAMAEAYAAALNEGRLGN